MIKGFTPRLYQETILATASQKNTLVVLPTGMGKTNVFLMLAAQRLKQYPQSKILLIGPTRPLIDQYYAVFLNNFDIEEEKMAIFTGQVTPAKREEMWKTAQIVFSTPQGLENDIISRKIDLSDVSLLGFDEAHRGVGDYAYVFVAKQYVKLAKYPRIVAMTASPGSDMAKIQEVCSNLFIEGIEVRTDKDPDVKPYVQEVDVDWVAVELPAPFLDVRKPLVDFLDDRMEKLRTLGILKRKNMSYVNKSELLGMQAELRGQLLQGEKDFSVMKGISILAEIMKISHAVELVETQGILAVKNYFDKIQSESRKSASKAVKNILADTFYKTAYLRANSLSENHVEHPKLIELQNRVEKTLKQHSDGKIIIFNQYRDNASNIVDTLNSIEGVEARLFVGQQKRGGTGMSQKQQKAMLDEFRDGNFNVLVATSIGEEGLDIPKVDTVIFYEPVPSAIRQIQRRGRTGRQEKGSVIVLFTKDTRDEVYRYVAANKERRMYKNLEQLQKNIGFELNARKEKSLLDYAKKEEVTIYADYREKGSGVIKELIEKDTIIKLESLPRGDFVLSSRVGVEFKNSQDFVDSIVDGRLLNQVKELKSAFERPIILIEGSEDIYSLRNVHPNAINGMLATIAISYGIPVLQTKTPKETAGLLYTMAKREQSEGHKEFSMHADRKPLSLKDQQEYVVSALPGVGPVLAKPLLKYFRRVKHVFNASQLELEDVEGIGKKKAEDIKKVLDEEYKD